MPDLPQILSDVLDRPDSERSAFLDGACGNNASLRAEVEALIEAHEKADAFLAEPLVTGPAVDATVGTALSEGPGTVIDKYKLLQLIGEGGFGAVYMAEQQKPVKRRVALKIIKLGMDTKQVIARFEAERQALAMMNHPNIATVLDAGATETGRPYFVMELVKGIPITEYCDQNNLTVHERLDLFKLVCAAVQHAHQKGIIHRDIKPSNVMVTLHDGKPVPKVIDFGIAKAMNRELTDKTLFTEYRQLIGTPQYMSPEQAEMSGLDIDTRSDIYALGVLLYELLTGTTPFDPKRLREAGLNEIQRIIREEEPHKPSTRLSTLDTLPSIAAHRGIEPRKLGLQIRGDLDWIIMKALEKDRTRRYDTAAGFAADVQRHLDDEPVVAGPPSAGYRLSKFVRRNRTSVIGATVIALVLLAATGVSIGFAISEAQQRRVAQAAEREQSLARAEAVQARTDEQKQRHIAVDARMEAETQRDVALRESYVANIYAADVALRDGETSTAKRRLARAPERLRNWEWGYLNAKADQSIATLRGHEGEVYSVAFSPDGTRLASASGDKTIRLWDTATGEALATLRGHEGFVYSVAFSPDGTRLASAPGAGGNMISLWDAATGDELATLRGHDGFVSSVAFSPDGTRLALALDKTIRVWDAATGEALATLRGHDGFVSSVAFSPDGTRLASASWDKTIRVWDATTGDELATLRGHERRVCSVAFSPDGTRLASASWDKTIRLWDAVAGGQLATLRGHEGLLQSVTFSPDGTRLASGSRDKIIKLWDAATGVELATLRGHEGEVYSVAFSPDGTRLASASGDKTIRLWDAATGDELATLRGHEGEVYSVAFSPDGTRLASASWDKTIRLWDAATGEALATLRGHEGFVSSVAFSPDGTRLASASSDKTIKLWDAATGEQFATLRGHESGVRSVTFSPDGTRLASGSRDKTIKLWDAARGEEFATLRGHEGVVGFVYSVAFSPDGTRLASASWDKTIRVWDAATGGQLATLRGHEGLLQSVAFSPDGTRLASASWDNTIRLWDAATGDELATLRGHERFVHSVAFSPDGTRLASASSDKVIKLWDAATGEELATLRGHEGEVYSVAFSPDGTRLASASGNKTIRLWDSVPVAQRSRERAADLKARSLMNPVVDRLFAELAEPSRIVEAIRDDSSLSDVQRHAALNLILQRCSEIYEQAGSLIDNLEERLVVAADIQAAVKENTSLEPAVRAEAIRIARLIEDTPRRLNAYAWKLLTVEPVDLRDPTAALPVAIKANEMTGHENPAYLDTLALAYHLTGDHEKAVETQQKAIALLTPDEPRRDEYEDHLAQFKAALPKE